MEDAFQHLERLASTVISGESKARMISRAFSISFLVYVWIIGWCGVVWCSYSTHVYDGVHT